MKYFTEGILMNKVSQCNRNYSATSYLSFKLSMAFMFNEESLIQNYLLF